MLISISFLYITNVLSISLQQNRSQRKGIIVYGHEKGKVLYGQWVNSGFLASCWSIQIALAIESVRVVASLNSNNLSADVTGSGNLWPLVQDDHSNTSLCHTCRAMSGKMSLCTTVASHPWLSRTQNAWASCTNWTEAQTCGSSTTAFWRMAACTSMLAFVPPRPQVWTRLSQEILVITIIMVLTSWLYGAVIKSRGFCFT